MLDALLGKEHVTFDDLVTFMSAHSIAKDLSEEDIATMILDGIGEYITIKLIYRHCVPHLNHNMVSFLGQTGLCWSVVALSLNGKNIPAVQYRDP